MEVKLRQLIYIMQLKWLLILQVLTPLLPSSLAVVTLTSLFSLGNVYITDNFNHRIRKVTIATGVISTIAGTGSTGYSGDNGQATSATLYYPRGVGLDSSGTFLDLLSKVFLYITKLHLGNVYIGDQSNNRIRKVTVSTGIITTFAGSSTSSGFSGDNGPATSATLYYPWGVAIDSVGIDYLMSSFFYFDLLFHIPRQRVLF